VSGYDTMVNRWLWVTAVAFLSVLVCASLWSAQRALKSKVRNYPNAPVVLKESKVRIVEVFGTPTQPLTPGAIQGARVRGSRVRYANRAGLLPSASVLEGEVSCQNQSRQTVEALEVAIVPLDAFHQPIRSQPRATPYTVQQMAASLPSGASQWITFEQLPLSSSDVYEVAVVITRIRFADGSVWLAPEEELIDVY